MPHTRPCSPSHSGALAMPAHTSAATLWVLRVGSWAADANWAVASRRRRLASRRGRWAANQYRAAAATRSVPPQQQLAPQAANGPPLLCGPLAPPPAPCSCSAWKPCRMGKSTSSSTTLPLSGISSYAAGWGAGEEGRGCRRRRRWAGGGWVMLQESVARLAKQDAASDAAASLHCRLAARSTATLVQLCHAATYASHTCL